MADITMCKDTACPKAKDCYRMNAPINEYWQSYFMNSPRQGDKCECFYPYKKDKKTTKH